MSTCASFRALTRAWSLVIGLCAAFLLAGPAPARAEGEVSVSAVPQRSGVHPGEQFAVAVVVEFEDGWHMWPEKVTLPPEIAGQLEPELSLVHFSPTYSVSNKANPSLKHEAGGLSVRADWTQWPQPTTVSGSAFGVDSVPALEHRAVIYVPVIVAPDAKPGPRSFTLYLYHQACNAETCLQPKNLTAEVKFEVLAPGAALPMPQSPDLFKDFNAAVFSKILGGERAPGADSAAEAATFDFLGYQFSVDSTAYIAIFLIAIAAGMLMNLTPCVLPVIPIKVISLQNQAKNPKKLVVCGAVYCAGIVAVFVLLAVLAFALSWNFGQWFSKWYINLPLALWIGFMAIGMLGLFAIRLPNWIYAVDASHETLTGNFMMGVLTGVLSTPCTGPMVGAAFAWATRQPPIIGAITIILMGVGMAAPYAVLILFPKLIDKLPRGGAGGELLKHVMGWFMLAVAVYVGSNVTSAVWPFWIVGALGVIGCLWWIIGSQRMLRSTMARVVNPVLASGGLLVTVIVTIALTGGFDGPWTRLVNKPDTHIRELVAEALADGKVVVVDFTAKWCTNCIAIEKTILSTDAAKALYERFGTRLYKVDLTNAGDNEGWGVVRAVLGGGGSIPLIAIYGPGTGPDKPEYFSSFFALNKFEEALQRASGAKVGAAQPR